jgi:hypothetical protein
LQSATLAGHGNDTQPDFDSWTAWKLAHHRSSVRPEAEGQRKLVAKCCM